ncbi:MAG: hypothetical protein KF914_19120 [Rhizobiaceae bacterium]|nr:hypothetical protein [Rhizobiaceae bacterium]
MRGAQASLELIHRASRSALVLSCIALSGMLAGCAAGGFSLKQAEVDPTILTGAVPPSTDPVEAPQLSDQATIRNAVSAADVESVGFAPLAWANAETGSRGTISRLVERRQDGRLCRSFTTSRESFDGVSLYSGKACMVATGAWRMEKFGAL